MGTPPSGFIHLVLLSQENLFYLEIPTAIVVTLCLKPRKYLRYLGWRVLGIIGDVSDEQGNVIALDGDLVDQGVYHYVVPGQNVLAHAVDLEVIKQRSQVPSETMGTLEDFSANLLERDGSCVWTGLDGIGTYIIPHERGDEWLQCIVDNRPHDENLDLLTINDIRNGIYTDNNIHNYFEPREVVVLKTPNPILETTDVPERCQRRIDVEMNVSYPTGSRYTLQWIVTPRETILYHFPNNNDATFMNQELPKPADVLLHYNYGAAVVKQWGKNASVLTNRPDVPRLPVPVQGGQGAGSKRKSSKGAAADLEAQDTWDEDDVILFLWGNSKAARERHAQREQERTAYLEDWRAAVTGNPDIV
ncbi:hypothetical protein BGY98DRAFT_916858 [Russula aff. rugulosa BPL654]|nr:hypothetical protein BGY98DRAFT_916858 [Russula aff. rugulosa BPL654]